MNKQPLRTSIKITDQQNIIKEIESGSKLSDVARKYSLLLSCVSRIYKRKENIASYSKSWHDMHVKRVSKMRLPKNEDLETVLYLWFCQQRSWRQPISGPLLCEKALCINETLGGSASFKASNGWLQRFKQRHGIRQLPIQKGKLFCNIKDIEQFSESFQSFCSNHGYTSQNIYNANETGLNWKTLPTSTLAAKYESSAAGFKVSKERITAMMCANASGTHRLPILIIHKYKNPKCMKNVCTLPVVYKAQKNAWMDRTLFFDWYVNTFIKCVLQKQTEENRNEKVLLLLDNAPSHPSEDQLNSLHENFEVMFLPPNVTAVLQPMDQIIEQTKKIYKQSVLRLVLIERLPQIEFLKQFTILDCCNIIAEAWNNVSVNNLRRAWKNLLPIDNAIDSTVNTSDEYKFANEIPTEICTEDEFVSWINADTEDQGWEPQSIIQIINTLKNNYDEHDSAEEAEPEEENDVNCRKNIKLTKEIIQNVHNFTKWLQCQEECAKTDVYVYYVKKALDFAVEKLQSDCM